MMPKRSDMGQPDRSDAIYSYAGEHQLKSKKQEKARERGGLGGPVSKLLTTLPFLVLLLLSVRSVPWSKTALTTEAALVTAHDAPASSSDVAETCDNGEDSHTCSEDGQQSSSLTAVYAPLGRPGEFIPSSTPGINLAVRRWIPPDLVGAEADSAEEEAETEVGDTSNIKSVVVFLHGGAGFHSGYSDILGTFLSNNGVLMIAYDQVGSGYSDRIDDIPAYFDSMDTDVKDIAKMLKDVRKEYPKAKIFAMGESFGCMRLLYHILVEQQKGQQQEQQEGGEASASPSSASAQQAPVLADGYIFSGPVVKLLPEMLPPPFVINILKFVSKYFPMLTTPGTDVFSTFDQAFGDPKWAAAGRADPFVREANDNPPKLGMAMSVLTSMGYVNDHLGEINVPFKIFMGERELRVDVDAVKKLAEVAKSSDKDIEVVEGGYHQLFQDVPNVTRAVCEGVLAWIVDRS